MLTSVSVPYLRDPYVSVHIPTPEMVEG